MKIYSYKSLISGSNRNTNYLCHDGIHSIVFFFLIITFLWVSPSQRDATRNNISHCISISIASFSSGLVLALRSIPAICSKIVYWFEIKVITGSFWLRQSVPVIMELSVTNPPGTGIRSVNDAIQWMHLGMQGPVLKRVDNAIPRINRHPRTICYPKDKSLPNWNV